MKPADPADVKDEKRYQLIAEAIAVALVRCDNEVEQRTALTKAVRRIDIRSRVDEDEALLARLSETEFKCGCRGNHPKSCPTGWARTARTALEDRIAMLHAALEPQTEQPEG